MMDLRSWQAEQTSESALRVHFRSEPPWKRRQTRILLRTIVGAALLVAGFFGGSCWQRAHRPPTAGVAAAAR
jgi:hypothetical protein